MKKPIVSVLTFFISLALSAQGIVIGDMNGDGKVTIGDVTEVVNTVNGQSAVRTISGKSIVDPYESDFESLEGTWRSAEGEVISLGVDGKASHTGMTTVTAYEYYPYKGDLVLLNSGDNVVEVFDVIRKKDNFVVMCKHGTSNYVVFFTDESFDSSITLSSTSLALKTGETTQLNATNQSAGNPQFAWSSSNIDVATVDQTGMVTAVDKGTCMISAKINDGSGTCAVCEVKVEKAINYNGHEYVDLGLPSNIKWATCNVGADTPEGCGKYYAWGETSAYGEAPNAYPASYTNAPSSIYVNQEVKTDYDYEHYKYMQEGATSWPGYSKYTIEDNQTIGCWYDDGIFVGDNKKELELEDDAAHVNWGGDWRMPTKAEFAELRAKCTWQWTSLNDVMGYKVTGPNGNSIFLPAAGSCSGESIDKVGSYGFYWTSTLHTNYSNCAFDFGFFSAFYNSSMYDRCNGFCVRAVSR